MKANGFRLDLLSAMNPEASESADLGQGGGPLLPPPTHGPPVPPVSSETKQ